MKHTQDKIFHQHITKLMIKLNHSLPPQLPPELLMMELGDTFQHRQNHLTIKTSKLQLTDLLKEKHIITPTYRIASKLMTLIHLQSKIIKRVQRAELQQVILGKVVLIINQVMKMAAKVLQ